MKGDVQVWTYEASHPLPMYVVVRILDNPLSPSCIRTYLMIPWDKI